MNVEPTGCYGVSASGAHKGFPAFRAKKYSAAWPASNRPRADDDILLLPHRTIGRTKIGQLSGLECRSDRDGKLLPYRAGLVAARHRHVRFGTFPQSTLPDLRSPLWGKKRPLSVKW